jgi:hypothetical protein
MGFVNGTYNGNGKNLWEDWTEQFFGLLEEEGVSFVEMNTTHL